jgi:hypothetical protein
MIKISPVILLFSFVTGAAEKGAGVFDLGARLTRVEHLIVPNYKHEKKIRRRNTRYLFCCNIGDEKVSYNIAS